MFRVVVLSLILALILLAEEVADGLVFVNLLGSLDVKLVQRYLEHLKTEARDTETDREDVGNEAVAGVEIVAPG